MVEYLHPTFMLVTLACVFMALRYGLAIRMRRLSGRSASLEPRALRSRHLFAGKLAVTLVSVGFVAGLATTGLWLGDVPLTTFHGLCASLGLLSFISVAILGHRLEGGRASAREAHAWAAFAATLCAATAAVAGFVLLP